MGDHWFDSRLFHCHSIIEKFETAQGKHKGSLPIFYSPWFIPPPTPPPHSPLPISASAVVN